MHSHRKWRALYLDKYRVKNFLVQYSICKMQIFFMPTVLLRDFFIILLDVEVNSSKSFPYLLWKFAHTYSSRISSSKIFYNQCLELPAKDCPPSMMMMVTSESLWKKNREVPHLFLVGRDFWPRRDELGGDASKRMSKTLILLEGSRDVSKLGTIMVGQVWSQPIQEVSWVKLPPL